MSNVARGQLDASDREVVSWCSHFEARRLHLADSCLGPTTKSTLTSERRRTGMIGTLAFRLSALGLMAVGAAALLGAAYAHVPSSVSHDAAPPVRHERTSVPLDLEGLAANGPAAQTGNLSWHLTQLLRASHQAQAQGEVIDVGNTSLLPKNLRDLVASGLMRITTRGEVVVELTVDGPRDELTSTLDSVGAVVEREDAQRSRMKTLVPIGRLGEAAALPLVQHVRLPSYGFVLAGSLTTEGDSALGADEVRSLFGVDGSGFRVGVISDGVEGLAESQASDDLPAFVNITTCNVLPEAGDFSPIGSRDPSASGAGAEGTAMLEIVHDLAPGAELWFGYWGMNLTNYGTSQDFNAAVNCLAEHVDVVIDDIGWFNNGPYDGTSPVSQNTAAALNHAGWAIRGYFNAVANQATRHYQASYVDSGVDITGDGDDTWDAHRFESTTGTAFGGYSEDPYGGGLAGDPTYFDHAELAPGGLARLLVQWDDPWGSSSNDYDVLVGDGTSVYYCSHNRQDGDDFPTEVCAYENTSGSNASVDFFIGNYKGTAAPRAFDVFLLCSGCQTLANNAKHNFNTPGSSVPNNSDAGGSPVPIMSLGAIDQADPGHDDIEYYSSRGPTNDGRTKPDATGIDGVSVTGSGGFPGRFFGASAAAPHGGGIAALLLQCDPSLDRAGLRNALLTTAVDLGDPGTDNTFGAGRLDALAAALSGLCPDPDGDQLTDVIDNCPDDYNPDQANTDAAAIDNGPDIPGDDATVPNDDGLGDACDDDDDNDWMLDTGAHPTLGIPGEDAGCGSGPTDPRNPDSDGDSVVDGAECLLGSDPNDPANKPPGTPAGDNDGDGLPASVEALFGSSDANADSDGDGISDGAEVKGWATSPASVDSDGDGCADWIEIADVNGDGTANILDIQWVAMAGFGLMDAHPALDLNKDGALNVLDVQFSVLNSNLLKPHVGCP